MDDGVPEKVVDAVTSATGALTNLHKLVETLRSAAGTAMNDHAAKQYRGIRHCPHGTSVIWMAKSCSKT